MRVVDAIAQWFEVAGFKHYFGYAGGAVWPFLDSLTDKPAIEGIHANHQSHAERRELSNRDTTWRSARLKPRSPRSRRSRPRPSARAMSSRSCAVAMTG